MTQIDVRLGIPDDVAAAVSVSERSNLARRHGDWLSRSARVAQVSASLHDDTAWFLIGHDGAEAIARAHVRAFRAGDGTGRVIPGTSFLNLIYVPPDHWG